VSLHTIVNDSFVGRMNLRRAPVRPAQPRARDMTVLLSGASMRVLEISLAVTALAVALLLGLGR
jgi:hypothetical protein